ncbi:MAG: XamI family restriction endonuclease [Acidimicrobiaceae bacterium]|nr:XamI family restriction endonuclease [Acidimicrobiaceae bacterium]MYA75576.1 XamI family restriction endonuclease [Acidimicrobiaceae bacterium]MYC43884.1 XamI family restriction endonuclease [Acidimicrobiaceae bacterium]MYD08066.1 XamI family restriction endonuclease [Acidimicrobiaceae bacterium]MYG56356.1 XamI family restriction endonuclease [Acidimicrobiaceae bacterium]
MIWPSSSDTSLAPGALSKNSMASSRVIETITKGIDPKRFPWVVQKRRAEDSELAAAAMATELRYGNLSQLVQPKPSPSRSRR